MVGGTPVISRLPRQIQSAAETPWSLRLFHSIRCLCHTTPDGSHRESGIAERQEELAHRAWRPARALGHRPVRVAAKLGVWNRAYCAAVSASSAASRAARFFSMERPIQMEISYNTSIGMARLTWLMTSGGVSTAATTKTNTMA